MQRNRLRGQRCNRCAYCAGLKPALQHESKLSEVSFVALPEKRSIFPRGTPGTP